MEEGGNEGREDAARKEELIGKILELQNTLHDLTQRVNSVKEENATLKAENDVSRPHTSACVCVMPWRYTILGSEPIR